MSEQPITNVEDAVAALGALPMPSGPKPMPLSVEQERAIRSLDLLALMNDRAAPVVSGHLAALLGEIDRLRVERHSTNESLDDAAKALREQQDRFQMLRALCDAADRVGIVSGGWFTVEAVRRAAAGEPLPKPDGITRRFAPTQALRGRDLLDAVTVERAEQAHSRRLGLEDPHDSPLHHPYTTPHDLPESDGAR